MKEPTFEYRCLCDKVERGFPTRALAWKASEEHIIATRGDDRRHAPYVARTYTRTESDG